MILAQTLAKDRMMSRELFITLYITVVLLILIVMNVFIVFVVVALTNTGTCEICLVDGDCPDKENQNVPTCKRGEYDCPDVCLHENGECGMKNAVGKTI